MASVRNADVNLIVRARTEGEKAVSNLGDILDALFDDARRGSGDIAELGKTLGALDKAAAAISGSMDKAGAAVDRQRASIVENNEAYKALVAQQGEATAAIARQDALVGPRTQEQATRYRAMRAEVERLDSAVSSMFGKIAQQGSQLGGTQSALLNLSSTSAAVANAQAEAEAQIELTNQGLREQAQAAEKVSEVQRRINALTGVDRPDATGSAARVADLLAAADAEYRRKEAAQVEAQALRQVNDQLAERANLEAALERTTGTGRTKATDSGATFSALAERERATEVSEREAKAARDLAEATATANNRLAERAQIEAALERTTGVGRPSAIDSGASVSALTELVNREHEAADASERMDKDAARLRATLDPLTAIQNRFNEALSRYKDLAAAGKIGADELAAGEAHLAAEAEKARAALHDSGGGGGGSNSGLFGLKPYELQNLGYQVNDVLTQLASGTSLTRTLGQQGGQIIQIFPRITSAIVSAFTNPVFLGAVAVAAGIAVGMKKAADDAERLRQSAAQTTFRADGADYDPKKLAGTEQGLARIGANAADAGEAVKTFLDEGIAPDKLNQFARAAQETAEVLGIKLPDAAQQIATAFTGGYQAVAALDDKLNFLTASEREHIRQLFEEGQAGAARTEALDAYTRRADAAAAKQRGPWGDAARSLGGAWSALIRYIADSAPIQFTIAVLDKLAGAAKAVGDAISGALTDNKPQTGAAAQLSNIARVQDQIKALKKEIADYEAAIAKKSPIAGTLQHLVDVSKQQLAAAEANLTKLEAGKQDTTNQDRNSPEAKRRSDELQEVSRADELQRLRDAGQNRLLTSAEKGRRAELAGLEAARGANDAVVAAALKRQAVAHETAKIEKESDDRAKSAAAEREREIRAFEGRVIGAEGGAGKNPHSSAKGYGQFTEGTFLQQFKTVFPGQSDLPREQILALRNNQQVAKAVIDNYARENAKLLESFGAKVTAGNLYLAHFLGGAGAKAVINAPSDKPVDQIIARFRDAGKVLSGNQTYLRTDGGKGRYRTAGELRTFIAGRVGDTGTAQTEGQVEINKLIEDATRHQDEFNLSVRHGVEDRTRALDGLRAEAGLYGTRLIAEQRAQAIAQAVLDLRQKAEDANKNLKPGETPVVLSVEQIAATKEVTGALFDAQHASEALNASLADKQRPLDALTEQCDLLREQAQFLRSVGDNTQADTVDEQIRGLGGDIGRAYDALIAFYQALSPDDQVRLGIVDEAQLDNIIGKLGQAKQASQEWGKVAGLSARSVAQSFGSSASTAFTNFINKVASGKNVFKAFNESIREFAANFLSSIAQMIVQLLAFMAAVQILRALGVPVPSAAFGVGQHHTGGIAGASAGGVRRTAPSEMFSGAMRYHQGGIAGFAPNEVPAVLQRGEEVLTTGDPRHRANGGLDGGDSGGPRSVKVVNVHNPADALAEALSSREGEEVLMNHVSRNSRAFKAAIG